jgi:hypothetical protein
LIEAASGVGPDWTSSGRTGPPAKRQILKSIATTQRLAEGVGVDVAAKVEEPFFAGAS